MALKGLFPQGGEYLVNYNWVDAVSGSGYEFLDGFKCMMSSGTTYQLISSNTSTYIVGGTPNVLNALSTLITGNSGISTDLDFDLTPFKLPRTLEGDLIARICVAASGNSVAGMVITIRVRKYSGSETTLVSASSDTFGLAATNEYARTLKLVVPKTLFKKGDSLRITLEISTTCNNTYYVGHNPRDSDLSATTNLPLNNSRLCIAVPYRLDFL